MFNLLTLTMAQIRFEHTPERTHHHSTTRKTTRCAWCERHTAGEGAYTNIHYCPACGKYQTLNGEQLPMNEDDLNSRHRKLPI